MSLNVLTQGGGGGEAATIFVTGLSENDVVTASNGSKTVKGKWGHKANPECVVPDGYTQLEYIESTGTQWTDTGVIPSGTNHTVEIAFQATEIPSSYESWIIGCWCGSASNSFRAGYQDGAFVTDCGFSYSQLTSFTVANGTSKNSTLSLYLFGQHESSGAYHVARSLYKLYYCKIYKDDALIRNFIPVKRNSDGAIGLYDLVNGQFYGNNGTGTFVAGAEIPKYIDGHVIEPIKEYGMWIVTATNGEDITTQDVLIDVATNFAIQMGFDWYMSDNFVGTKLNTDLWTWRADYTATCTVNNGITISNGSDADQRKIHYLQLNKLFTGKEKHIKVSATVTGLSGSFKESTISLFTGREPSTWDDNPVNFCGIAFGYTTYSSNSMKTIKASSLVSSGSVTKNENLKSHTVSHPIVWTIEVDLEEGTFKTTSGGTTMYSGTLPDNMELTIGKPFLFITSTMWYANSISLSNVTVEIDN